MFSLASCMRQIFTLFLFWGVNTICNAGAFSVTPVRLFFEPKDKAVAITLMNEGEEEIVLQADIYKWTQGMDGNDQIGPTEDLIVSPPSLRLPAHSKQVVRVGLLTPRDRSSQMTYRLVVQEIPEAEKRKDSLLQLPIALVLNMPIFITPSGASRKVECGWAIGKTRKPELSCMNAGSAYAQVRSAELRRGGDLLAKAAASTYILAGARRTLTLQEIGDQSLEPGIADVILVYDDLKVETQSIEIP
jgi:fimbrial chaperone protein